MALEHTPAAIALPAAERRQAGQALRKLVPRSLQAHWKPTAWRQDPVEVLVQSGRHRIASLLPTRYDRMRTSAFGFFRGAAAIMAADLADTPTTGLWVQSSATVTWLISGRFPRLKGRQSSN